MDTEVKHVQGLIELWDRRHEPIGSDVPLSLHIARIVERSPAATPALRSLSWHLVTDIHDAAGWDIPRHEKLSACRTAAASVAHTCALITEEISSHVRGIGGDIIVLGSMAASRTLFGRWDVLPTTGALLISLDDGDRRTMGVNATPSHLGVRWGTAGGLSGLLRRHSTTADLHGCLVRVPNPELIVARTPWKRTRVTGDLESVIFCAASRASVLSGTWHEALQLAPRLGNRGVPSRTARQLGIEGWLRLGPQPASGLLGRLRSALHLHAAG